MIVRNVVFQGYPFLEAIRSALPICDEFLISDGYSDDATWEGLEQLRKRYPGKIRLFREAWQGGTFNGEILGEMSNRLLRHCRGEYCLNLQANEIIPTASLRELARLPSLHPKADLFSFPFRTVMGRNLSWLTEQRTRLFRRVPEICSLGDAYDAGVAEEYKGPGKRSFERVAVSLGQPFIRYRGLYPVNYIRKSENRMNLFHSPASQHYTVREVDFATSILEPLRSAGQAPEAFWIEIRRYFDDLMRLDNPENYDLGPTIPEKMIGFLGAEDGLIHHLPDTWEYDLRDSLAALG